MVINADCSLGNLSLVPAPTSGSSQLSVIPVLEGSDALGLHEHLHSCADAYTLACTHTIKNDKKYNIYKTVGENAI